MDENVSRSAFEANAALNAQEFANRQILLKGDGVPSSPAPFGATYIDQTANPPAIYRQLDAGVGSNWTLEGSGGAAINGAVFITDIEPQDPLKNVGQKVFSSDGEVLDSAVTNTDLIRVSVIAAIGTSNYKPSITVKGVDVDLTQSAGQPIWTGTVDIDLQGATDLTTTHEDGATHQIAIAADTGSEVTSALFVDGYPAGQTELKEDDTFDLQVLTDTPMVRIEVEDFGAAQAEVFDFSENDNVTITLKIADRGNSAQPFGVRLRAMNSNGSFGEYFLSDSQGNNDGEHTVILNNAHPAGIIDAIEYPVGQLAIKDNEPAQVDLQATGYDQILYSSPNGELGIVNPNTFEPFKVVNRASGAYNVTVPNILVTMTKTSNGAVTTANAIVQIAHVDPSVSIFLPASRLRSGGNQGTQVQNHSILLNSDQELLQPPVISAPHGTLEAVMVDQGDKLNWTQNMRVHDDDQEGGFQFSLTSAVNLAGKSINVIGGNANYQLGGFVSRTIQVPPFNNELAIGTNVSDTSKVIARDKDGILLVFQNSLANQLKAYAFTAPSNTLNINGNLFFWADQQAVNNNTTGLATITIEEAI